eukprot:1185329-Prorocentrum_minimum.AAC.9
MCVSVSSPLRHAGRRRARPCSTARHPSVVDRLRLGGGGEGPEPSEAAGRVEEVYACPRLSPPWALRRLVAAIVLGRGVVLAKGGLS